MKLVRKNTGIVLALVLLPLLTACSSVTHSKYAQNAGLFPDRDSLYAQGKSVPPLQVPTGVAAIPNDPYFVIPALADNGSAKVSLLPPGSLAAQKAAAK